MTPFSDAEVTAAWEAKLAERDAEIERLKASRQAICAAAAGQSMKLAAERARLEYVWKAFDIPAKLGIAGQYGDIRALIDTARGATDGT